MDIDIDPRHVNSNNGEGDSEDEGLLKQALPLFVEDSNMGEEGYNDNLSAFDYLKAVRQEASTLPKVVIANGFGNSENDDAIEHSRTRFLAGGRRDGDTSTTSSSSTSSRSFLPKDEWRKVVLRRYAELRQNIRFIRSSNDSNRAQVSVAHCKGMISSSSYPPTSIILRSKLESDKLVSHLISVWKSKFEGGAGLDREESCCFLASWLFFLFALYDAPIGSDIAAESRSLLRTLLKQKCSILESSGNGTPCLRCIDLLIVVIVDHFKQGNDLFVCVT